MIPPTPMRPMKRPEEKPTHPNNIENTTGDIILLVLLVSLTVIYSVYLNGTVIYSAYLNGSTVSVNGSVILLIKGY